MKFVFFSVFSLFYAFSNVFAETANEFKVGVVQSLTGMAAEDGTTVVNSLKLAQEKINAESDLKVKLIIEDDQSSSKTAVTSYRRLVAGGVEAIVGATWDFTTNPLLPMVGRDKLVLLSTSTLPESLNLHLTSGYGFVNSISTYDEAKPFVNFLKKHQIHSLAILYANNSWGETQFQVYSALAKQIGVKIVSASHPSFYDENDFRTIALKIDTHKPQLIVLLLNKNDIETFLTRASELKIKSKYFLSKNAYDAFRLSQKKELFENTCFTYPLEQIASEASFNSLYYKKYNSTPRLYADSSYDALFLLHKAKLFTAETHSSLKDALMKVSHDGIAGQYNYSKKNSFSTGTSSLVCVKNNKLQVIQ